MEKRLELLHVVDICAAERECIESPIMLKNAVGTAGVQVSQTFTQEDGRVVDICGRESGEREDVQTLIPEHSCTHTHRHSYGISGVRANAA